MGGRFDKRSLLDRSLSVLEDKGYPDFRKPILVYHLKEKKSGLIHLFFYHMLCLAITLGLGYILAHLACMKFSYKYLELIVMFGIK